jgi:hypothetical protein
MADELNYCEAADECQPVFGYMGCSSLYINESEDATELQEAIDAANGGQPVGCILLCQCAMLGCVAGKCSVDPNGCDAPSDDQVQVCL